MSGTRELTKGKKMGICGKWGGLRTKLPGRLPSHLIMHDNLGFV